MEPNHEHQSHHANHGKNSGMALLSYIGILVIIPLVSDSRHDPFVKFHAKQGLALLIVWVLGSVFFWIPVIGWLLWLCVFVLMILGIMNAVNGQEKELPIIGGFAKNFNF
ncbi:MAG TPA: DUF4870 domain-containing protein [Patescibacteria group bacterium]|nr:DUF4870 domain-containing protein [Patescibacteria group bacterium]